MPSENRISYVGVKRQFNPTSKEDLTEYKYFLENERWKDTCPFITEPPFESVIFVIERRIATHWIDSLIETTK